MNKLGPLHCRRVSGEGRQAFAFLTFSLGAKRVIVVVTARQPGLWAFDQRDLPASQISRSLPFSVETFA